MNSGAAPDSSLQKASTTAPPRPLTRPWVAWVVLAVCLLATGIGWTLSLSQLRYRARERFEQRMLRVTQAIQARMFTYEQLLRGAGGLFAASQSVERSEWQFYVNHMQLEASYPGTRALGFIARVPAAERDRFVASNRLVYASQFTISPPGDRPQYYVVQYVSPELPNSSALGYDFATEQPPREEAESARDSGKMVLSRRMQLIQKNEEMPAVMLLLPIYDTKGVPPTVAQRRASLAGWVYAAIVMESLMDQLLEGKGSDVDFEILDDTRSSPQTPLYDSNAAGHVTTEPAATFTDTLPVIVLNQKWAVRFRSRPEFDALTDYSETRLLVAGGVCISLLLFGITRSLATTRLRALSLAEQMTEKLRIQERAVISSNNGIFITDASQPRNPILYANPAMERITGDPAEALRGMSVPELMGEDPGQPGLAILSEAMKEGRECRVILRSRRRGGGIFWVELNVSPVRDGHGMVNHFVGIVEDITERKHAEETLRATSALQRAILDSAGYAVISTSPEGRIRVFNAAAERMTGCKASEVVGQPTSVLIHDWTEIQTRARELSQELGQPVNSDFEVFVARARLGQADEHEWTYLRKDGTRIPMLLSVTPVRDERGIILGFMGIASDITERKRVEAELQRATQAAESANRAKSQFLANMSHEIRTPMNAVIGMTELALGTDLTREQRGYLSAARNSAVDLLSIINDILDFSKIEAGKLELHPEPFSLRDALGLTLKAFSLRAAEKGLELTLRVDADVPDALVGDVVRLRQIVNNLVGNALKFTERGEVRVEVARAGSGTIFFTKPYRTARGAAQSPPFLLHVTVADSGIGIPQDKQQTIFEAFTQADASVTRRYGGTGLGLAISSKLCHLMEGEIWVESEPGKGSQFHFTAAFALTPGGRLPVPGFGLLAGAPVLVIDDNTAARQVLVEMLACWGMVPSEAADASTARATIASANRTTTPFRFVLMDAQIAGADTVNLAREITSNRGGPPPPALILTQPSAGGSVEAEEFRAAGVGTFLVKPIVQSELLNALAHCAGAPQEPVPTPGSAYLGGFAGSRSLEVLLAEDNAVNRELATTVLRKMGHAVTTVVNGQQALAAWEKGRFDLILMDVQMPAMDGIEATALIREREAGSGRHIPIIGLTAHAMLGDREHGLAAGMDEYVTKPLQFEQLARAIRRFTPSDKPGPSSALSGFRAERLLGSLGGDEAALRRLVRIYLETTPALMDKLRRALGTGDAAAALHAAHTLKGSLVQLDAAEASALAAQLEARARAGTLQGLGPEVARLDELLQVLQRDVHRWLGDAPAAVPISDRS